MVLPLSDFERKILNILQTWFVIDSNGITILPASDRRNEITELISEITNQPQANFDSNTTDGQMVDTMTIMNSYVFDMLVKFFNSVNDPLLASGVWLDTLVGEQGIIRNAGSFTELQINVTTSIPNVSLNGLDNPSISPFKVSDGTTQVFDLIDSIVIPNASTTALLFRAENQGSIIPALNTLNTIITQIDGVSSVNNPIPPSQIGSNEETDGALRSRYQSSLASKLGGVEGLYSALSNITDVSDVAIDNNTSDLADTAGTPPHSVYIVVNGGNDDDIANAIYNVLSAGTGMKGTVVVNVVGSDSVSREIKFDRPNPVPLYIKITLTNSIGSELSESIKQAIVSEVQFGISQSASVATLYTVVNEQLQSNGGNTVLAKISSIYIDTNPVVATKTIVNPTQFNDKFVLDIANINIEP